MDNDTMDAIGTKPWMKYDKDTGKPIPVTVVLLRDNKPTHDGEVTLNTDNDWTYTWEGLDSNFYWEVTEKDVPDS